VDPDMLSEDAKEWNCEGFFALLENLIVDGLQHMEPKVDTKQIVVTMNNEGDN
jgi:hypothetical protein